MAILFFTLIGCEKKDPPPEYIPEGYYSGSFIFSEDTVFDAIIFNADTFTEVPSGGAMNQKFPCLVEGTYAIQEGKIEFSVLNYPEEGSNCDPDKLLTGLYDMILSGDSLEFKKGEGVDKQQYKMKKVLNKRDDGEQPSAKAKFVKFSEIISITKKQPTLLNPLIHKVWK